MAVIVRGSGTGCQEGCLLVVQHQSAALQVGIADQDTLRAPRIVCIAIQDRHLQSGASHRSMHHRHVAACITVTPQHASASTGSWTTKISFLHITAEVATDGDHPRIHETSMGDTHRCSLLQCMNLATGAAVSLPDLGRELDELRDLCSRAPAAQWIGTLNLHAN